MLFVWVILGSSLLMGACRPQTITRTQVTTATARPSLTPVASTTPLRDTLRETPLAVTIPPACQDAPPRQLILMERGQVTDNGDTLNLRANAGTNFEILLRLEPRAIFMVLSDSPQCVEGFTWFRVQYNDVVGWIAEGDLTEYYAVPYLPG